MYRAVIRGISWEFPDLRTLMARASPRRSADELGGLCAQSATERVAAQRALSEVPLQRFLEDPLVAPALDAVSRLILAQLDPLAFAEIRDWTVGDLRAWLVDPARTADELHAKRFSWTPEMLSAVSKLLGNSDLLVVSRRVRAVTHHRGTIGREGTLPSVLLANHPTDHLSAIAQSAWEGLRHGYGDAAIFVRPCAEDPAVTGAIIDALDAVRRRHHVPTQIGVSAPLPHLLQAMRRGAAVDLLHARLAGTEKGLRRQGVSIDELTDADEEICVRPHDVLDTEGTFGGWLLETGQGSAVLSGTHLGMDALTCAARAMGVARALHPLLVLSTVGFVGPGFADDGRQYVRTALEDLFCGKLLGLPMATSLRIPAHAAADHDDIESMVHLCGQAGTQALMVCPGADDRGYHQQTASFRDLEAVRRSLQATRAPEFERWWRRLDATDGAEAERSHAVEAHCDRQAALNAARDAIHTPWPVDVTAAALQHQGWHTVRLHSDVRERPIFLRNPHLGRKLSNGSRSTVEALRHEYPDLTVVWVLSDGLSPLAVLHHGAGAFEAFQRVFGARARGPVLLVPNARDGVADEIALALGASISVFVSGALPGLSATDALHYTLTRYGSPSGTLPRWTIPNVLPNGGLEYELAAHRALGLVVQGLKERVAEG